MQWSELDRMFDVKDFQRELYLIGISQKKLATVLDYSEKGISKLINGKWKKPDRWRRAIVDFVARAIVAKALALDWGEQQALECATRALQGINFNSKLVIEEAKRYKERWEPHVDDSKEWLNRYPHPALAITTPKE